MSYLITPNDGDFIAEQKSLTSYRSALGSRNKKNVQSPITGSELREPNNFKTVSATLLDTGDVNFVSTDITPFDPAYFNAIINKVNVKYNVIRINRKKNTRSFDFSLIVKQFADINNVLSPVMDDSLWTIKEFYGSIIITGASVDRSRTTFEKYPFDIHATVTSIGGASNENEGPNVDIHFTYDTNYIYIWIKNFSPYRNTPIYGKTAMDDIASVALKSYDAGVTPYNVIDAANKTPHLFSKIILTVKDTSISDITNDIEIVSFNTVKTTLDTLVATIDKNIIISPSTKAKTKLYNIGLSDEVNFVARGVLNIDRFAQFTRNTNNTFAIKSLSDVKNAIISKIKSLVTQTNTVFFEVDAITKPILVDYVNNTYRTFDTDDSISSIIRHKEYGTYNKVTNLLSVKGHTFENLYSNTKTSPLTKLKSVFDIVKKRASPTVRQRTEKDISLSYSDSTTLPNAPEMGGHSNTNIGKVGTIAKGTIKKSILYENGDYKALFMVGNNYVGVYNIISGNYIELENAIGNAIIYDAILIDAVTIVVAGEFGRIGYYAFDSSTSAWTCHSYDRHDGIIIVGSDIFGNGNTIYSLAMKTVDNTRSIYASGGQGFISLTVIKSGIFINLWITIQNGDMTKLDDITLSKVLSNGNVIFVTKSGKMICYDGVNYTDYTDDNIFFSEMMFDSNLDLTRNRIDHDNISSMSGIRYWHTATLYNGKIYVIGGGSSSATALATCEVYDIASNVWSAITSMAGVRYGHTATLYNGKIYVVGGYNGTATVNTCECYNIAGNNWTTPMANMTNARLYHTATLYNGKIYVVGGRGTSAAIASCECYDIASNNWTTPMANMSSARQYHTATLYNGKIYIIGGYNTVALATCEVYDIVSNVWNPMTNMTNIRYNHTATLYNGKIYVTGGANTVSISSCEMYDITSNVWNTMSIMSMSSARQYHTATLYNGKIYVCGGISTVANAVCEVYDIASNIWSPMTNMYTGRYNHAVTFCNGKIYVIGGYTGTVTINTCEIFDIALSNRSRSFGGSSLIDNKLYMYGGKTKYDFAVNDFCMDLDTNKTTEIPQMNVPRYGFNSTTANGKIYVYGGYATIDQSSTTKIYSTPINSIEVYDPTTNKWTLLDSTGTALGFASIAIVGNYLYVFGGSPDSTGVNPSITFNRYNLTTNVWENTDLAVIPNSFVGATSVVSGAKIYVFCENNIYSYNTSNNTWDTVSTGNDYYVKFGKGFIYGDTVYFSNGTICIGSLNIDITSNLIKSNKCVSYNITSGKWTNLASSPLKTVSASVAVYKDVLYTTNNNVTSDDDVENYTIYKYYIKKNQWATNNAVNISSDSVVYGGAIYTNGGHTISRKDVSVGNCKRTQHISVSVGGLIYVLGGYCDTVVSNSCEVYNPVTNKWSNIASMRTARALFGAAAYNGKIYVVGGGVINLCEVYDIASDTWTAIAVLNYSAYGVAVVAYNGYIYACGGYYSGSAPYVTAATSRYDISTNQWIAMTAMKNGRHLHSALLYNNKIFVIGGHNGYGHLNSCEVYDIASNTWTNIASMITPRYSNSCSVIYKDKIYIFGGEVSANTPTTLCECYDIVSNVWTAINPLPAIRGYSTAILIDDNVYIIEGSNTPAGGVAQYHNTLIYNLTSGKIDTAIEDHDVIDSFTKYIPKLNKSVTLTSRSDKRIYKQSVVYNSKIYFFGGLRNTRKYNESTAASSIAEVYDIATDTWSDIAPLPTPTYGGGAVVYNNKIYIFGGLLGYDTPNNLVYSYDSVADKYTIESALTFRDKIGMFGYCQDPDNANYVYIVGGLTSGRNTSNSVYRFDLSNGEMLKLNIQLDNPMYDCFVCKTKGTLTVVGGRDTLGNDFSNKITTYNYTESYMNLSIGTDVSKINDMNFGRSAHTVTVVGTKIYVTGGIIGGTTLATNTCEVYDTIKNTWTPLSNMISSRYQHAAVLYNNKIYVTGGYTGTIALATCEVYDIANDTWSAIASMSSNRYCHASAQFGLNAICAIGGIANGVISATCEVYIPETNRWMTILSMNNPRKGHTAITYNGKVYVFGGETTNRMYNNCETCDTAGVWTVISESPVYAFSECSASLYNDSVYITTNKYTPVSAMGVVSPPYNLTIVMKYNITKDEWSMNYNTSKCRVIARSAVCNNNLYIIGGTNKVNSSTYADTEKITLNSVNTKLISGMNKERMYHTATLYNNKIYVIGGSTVGGVVVATGEVYDISSGRWTDMKTSMSGPRMGHTSTLYNGKIYVFGGSSNVAGTALNTCEVYDITSDVWSTVAITLPTARAYHTATLFGSTIYFIGGTTDFINGITDCVSYDIVGNAWTTQNTMMNARFKHCAELVDNGLSIKIVGGISGTSSVSVVEIFNLVTKEFNYPSNSNNAWNTIKPMAGIRYCHTATLYNGKIYVIGGCTTAAVLATCEVYDIVSDTWTAMTSMSTTRDNHTATLYNGKIYVCGGYTATSLATCIIYDIANNNWTTPMASMANARSNHTATLYNGKIYVIGESTTLVLPSCECYDIAGNTWATMANMTNARIGHTAILYNNKIYVIGGANTASLATCECYDIAGNSWTSTSMTSMSGIRTGHTATLYNGKIYVTGGFNGSAGGVLTTCEVYDIASNTWSPMTSMTSARYNHTATLYNNKIYVTGGSSTLATCECYDISLNSWTSTTISNTSAIRSIHTATLYNNKIYICGGCNTVAIAVCEVYDMVSVNKWTSINPMSVIRTAHTATLYNGKIYVCGGISTTAVATCEVYDIASNTWSPMTSMAGIRVYHTATLYNEKIYVCGGYGSGTTIIATCECYDIASNTWSPMASMAGIRNTHTATLYNGKIYVIGGYNGTVVPATCECYDTAINVWSPIANMTSARYNHTATLYNGKIYVCGGNNGAAVIATCECYDIAGNSWISTPMASMSGARQLHTATLYNGKIYVCGGISTTAVATCEVYDIASNTWSPMTSMTSARYNHTATLYNGKIYVVGGYATVSLATCEVYDIVNNKWSFISNMNNFRKEHTAILYNNKIYVCGGYNGTATIATCECYDIARSYSDSSTFVINNNIYNIGGKNNGHEITNIIDNEIYNGGVLQNGELSNIGIARCGHASVNNGGDIYVLGGSTDGSTPISTCEKYTPNKKNIMTGRSNFTSIVYNGKIYVMGGQNTAGLYLKTCEVYDPVTNKWSFISNMNNFRKDHAATLYNGKIYVCGGSTGTETTVAVSASCEVYDITNNVWNNICNMVTARTYFGVFGYNNKLYAFHGSTGAALIATCEYYDMTLNTWTVATATIANMLTQRAAYAYIFYNNKFYVFGGNNGTTTLYATGEIYDPTTNVWTTFMTGTVMTVARTFASIIAYNNRLYIVGGINAFNDMTIAIEIFDITSVSYGVPIVKIKTNLINSNNLVSVGNKMYLIGGQDPIDATKTGITQIYDIDGGTVSGNNTDASDINNIFAYNALGCITTDKDVRYLSYQGYASQSIKSGNALYVYNNNLLKKFIFNSIENASSILEYNGNIIITTANGSVVSLDATKLKWRYSNGAGDREAPSIFYQDIDFDEITSALIDSDRLILTASTNDIYSIDLLTNEVVEETGYGSSNTALVFNQDKSKLFNGNIDIAFKSIYKITINNESIILFLTTSGDVISYNETFKTWTTNDKFIKEFFTEAKLTVYPAQLMSIDTVKVTQDSVHND